jgi:hypothetical protein
VYGESNADTDDNSAAANINAQANSNSAAVTPWSYTSFFLGLCEAIREFQTKSQSRPQVRT